MLETKIVGYIFLRCRVKLKVLEKLISGQGLKLVYNWSSIALSLTNN